MILILLGTRPEIIKLSPFIHELQKRRVVFKLVHSNQHYDENLDSIFLEELSLPHADFNLRVGSGSQAQQTAKILTSFEKICIDIMPDLIVVHGDTNTALAGALVGKKCKLKVAHIEAGLRSYDMEMPEEVNRIIIDHIADFLFAPTKETKNNLVNEGIKESKIFVTGNTIVDAILTNQNLSNSTIILKKYNLQKNSYILLTAHRPSSVDTKSDLNDLLILISKISNKLKMPVLWPIHPRTKASLKLFSLSPSNTIHIIPPTGYSELLTLIKSSALVLTDSGGIQEEAFILKRPLMTIRDTTERPETLTANFLIKKNYLLFEKAWQKYQNKDVSWKSKLGNGNAAIKICNIIQPFERN